MAKQGFLKDASKIHPITNLVSPQTEALPKAFQEDWAPVAWSGCTADLSR